MEDLRVLVQRGVIYDGCPIVAKGTIRIQGGEISIDTMHNLMAVDGKNFAALCGPATNEQGDLHNPEEVPEIWKAKIDQLTSQHERVVADMKKSVEGLQTKLDQERSLRSTFEDNMAREKRIGDESTQLITELRSKLTDEVGRMDDLRSQLDSAGILLEEKEEKLRELQQLLAEKDARVREYEAREKEALMLSEALKEHVVLLEEERMEEKKNSAVLLDDFSEWRNGSEEEITELKKELDHCKTTINTLHNELEVAELEDSSYQQTISALQKENDALKHLETERHVEEPPKKLKSQRSLKNLLKGITKPLQESGKERKDSTKERKDSTKEKRDTASKRDSTATAPSL